MVRPDKAAAVAELTDAFRDSTAAVLTEYRGLTVAQLKELRTSLAGNATYSVVKNTLSKIAAREAGVEGLDALLEGPSAIAFVTGDPVEVAKGLRDFAKNNPPLIVKGGVLDGKPLSADEVRRLADLESREVLLAKLAGGMKASLQQAVSMFAAPLSQFARLAAALEAKAAADPSVLAGGAGQAPVDPAPADTAPADTAPADTAAVEAAAPAEPEAPAEAVAEAPAEDAAAQAEPAQEAPVAAEAVDETAPAETTEVTES